MTTTFITLALAFALIATYWAIYHRPKQRRSQRQISHIEDIADLVSQTVDLFRSYQAQVFKQIDNPNSTTSQHKNQLLSVTNNLIHSTRDLNRHESTLRILGDGHLADSLRIFCNSIIFFRHQLQRYHHKQIALTDLHHARDQVLKAQQHFYQQISKGYNQALSRL